MSAGHYHKKQGKASKKACERYQDLSEEKKNKQRYYARERYRNLSNKENKKQKYGGEQHKNFREDEKQRLVECKKSYSKMWKKRTD